MPVTGLNSWFCMDTRFSSFLLEYTHSGTTVKLPFFSSLFSNIEVPTTIGVDLMTVEEAVFGMDVRDGFGRSSKLKMRINEKERVFSSRNIHRNETFLGIG